MSILILDDETHSRLALRRILSELGHKKTLFANNDTEAINLLNAEKGSIRFIIAEKSNEMRLLRELQTLSAFDSIPFLMTSFGISSSKLKSYRERYPRFDSYLAKPFRKSALLKAMSDAFMNRVGKKNTLLFFGNKDLGERLIKAKDSEEVIVTQSISELSAQIKVSGKNMSTIILDSEYDRNGINEWLNRFKRTPTGTKTLVVCLGKDPNTPSAIKTHCSLFFNRPTSDSELRHILLQLRTSRSSDFLFKVNFDLGKSKLQKNSLSQAEKYLESARRFGGTRVEVFCVMGDFYLKKGNDSKAVESFRQALELNPFSPHPYIRLMELFNLRKDPARVELANRALNFCPNHPEVTSWASRIKKEAELSREI